jgi:hypothetical protein
MHPAEHPMEPEPATPVASKSDLPRARHRARAWVRRLCVAVGVTIITVLAAEVALQVFYYATVGQWLFTRTGLPLFVPDERFVYWNKPNLAFSHRTNEFHSEIFTNGQGFRIPGCGGDYPTEKPADTRRILLLGSSFAFGWGVDYEQTLAARLQVLLNRDRPAGSPSTEIIDTGVPSMGPALNLDWYRAVGKDFSPDLVIQIIYTTMAVPRVGNRNDIGVDEQGYLIRRNLSFRQRATSYVKRSAIVFYSWMAVVRARGAFAAPNEGGAIIGAGREAELHGAFDPKNPEVAEAVAYYDDLRDTVVASGAKLLIVFVPLGYCVHHEDVARWSHLGVRDVDVQIAYDAAFCDFLTAHGFDCVNTTSALRQAATTSERMYYFVDIHWTPAGNDVAARAVYEQLAHEEEPRP